MAAAHPANGAKLAGNGVPDVIIHRVARVQKGDIYAGVLSDAVTAILRLHNVARRPAVLAEHAAAGRLQMIHTTHFVTIASFKCSAGHFADSNAFLGQRTLQITVDSCANVTRHSGVQVAGVAVSDHWRAVWSGWGDAGRHQHGCGAVAGAL